MAKLSLFFAQFAGYLWYLSLYVIVLPYFLIKLSQGLDFLVLSGLWENNVPEWVPAIPAEVLLVVALLVLSVGVLIIIESSLTLYEKAHSFPFVGIPHEHLRPQQLAQGGWYGRARHPMLFGYLLVLVGVGMMVHSWSMVLWWVPLYGGLMLEYELMVEEKQLRSWFGDDYVEYQKSVPALIPQLRSRKKVGVVQTGG